MTLLEVSPFSSLDEIRAATGCAFEIAPSIKGA
jgi:acyl CoA:acetate/3-ketoacid CoA transferase beta subunit